MKRESKHVNILRLCAVLVAFAFPANVVSAKTLKVFILAGQSNMVGAGEITKAGYQGTLEYMVDNDMDGTFAHLVDGDGNWVVRDDVWIWFNKGGSPINGGLSVGYGGGNGTTIGPEMQFGHVMGDYYSDQVLLIKTAWGGKSLAVNFRSDYTTEPVATTDVGYYYKLMIDTVKDFMANPKSYYPAYNIAEDSYEIVGFGWHQGWNDRINQTYNDEYEENMKNFINNVRADLGVPKMPFVIATTGMKGWGETSSKALSLMEAQLAMEDFTKYPEFEGNVAVVETRGFWRTVEESPANQSYHWNRNAETYFLIGNGMGEDMLDLIIDPDAPSVDAGIDMITWSGQAVPMDPTIVEVPGSDWTNLTYLWTAEPNGIGDPNLDVVITDANQEDASVTITKAAPTGDATVVKMTLEVNNAGRLEPPVKDSMTIAVYDDGCKAAIGAGLATDNPTDFDENCITGFGDLDEMAAKWLIDHVLTEAEPKQTFALKANPDDGFSLGWSYQAWTDDSTSGLDSSFLYTAAHHFCNTHTGGVQVNEVDFTGGRVTSGAGWNVGGAIHWHTDGSANITGDSAYLADQFLFGAEPRTVQFTGLTIGKTYKASFFSVGWDNSGRIQIFSSEGNDLVLDQDYYGNNNGIVISYTYLATAASQNFTIAPTTTVGTFHMYALANKFFDPDAPSVDAGPDMIAWSGADVPMAPTIVEAPGSDWTNLTYLWTAEPDGIGDPDLDVAITGADTENASVTITKSAPTGDATVVTMTLAVNNEGRTDPPITDSMTIDVYDDSCLAAKALGTVELDITDVDQDCITAFPDFALMAVTWLEDYTLTEVTDK